MNSGKLLLGILAASLVVSAALAEEPLTFKGFELGADRSSFLAAFPKPLCKGSPEHGDTCFWTPKDDCPTFDTQGPCFKAFNYGGVLPNNILVTFYKARLVRVSVYFPEPRFRELRDAITERFGTPAVMKNDVVQNRMGATFDNTRLIWTRGDAILSLRQRGSKIDEGVASLMSKTFSERMREEGKDAVKRRAKDL
jgi:hypothetical protein